MYHFIHTLQTDTEINVHMAQTLSRVIQNTIYLGSVKTSLHIKNFSNPTKNQPKVHSKQLLIQLCTHIHMYIP